MNEQKPQGTHLISRGILAESNYRSRQEILASLRHSGLIHNIVEAQSTVDVLRRLENGGFDACFLGPSLTIEASRHIVDSAAKLSSAQSCAFIAFTPKGSDTELLKESVSVHDVIEFPFENSSFVKRVTSVVETIREDTFRKPAVPTPQLNKQEEKFIGSGYSSLADMLFHIAMGLRSVRHQSQQKLGTGTPSEADIQKTLTRIRTIFENGFTMDGQTIQKNSYDAFFIDALVEWFKDASIASPKIATDLLRKKLVGWEN